MANMLSRMMGGGATGSVEATVDTSAFVASLNRWWNVTKQDIAKMLRDEANLLAEALINYTPSYAPGGGGGLKSSSFKRSKGVIQGTTESVFKPLWKIPSNFITTTDSFDLFLKAKAAGKARKKGAMGPVMRKIYNDPVPEQGFKRLKQYLKNRKSRNTAAVHPISSVDWSRYQSVRVNGRIKNRGATYYVEVPETIKKVISQAQSDIGLMKSGWAHAAMQISGSMPRRTPPFVSRHGPRYGSSQDKLGDPDKPELVLINKVGNIFNLGLKFNVVQEAFNLRTDNITRRTQSVLNAACRRGLPTTSSRNTLS